MRGEADTDVPAMHLLRRDLPEQAQDFERNQSRHSRKGHLNWWPIGAINVSVVVFYVDADH
jgi:hypothetical protein